MWPSGIQQFSALQLLELEYIICGIDETPDIAALRHIPHHQLFFKGAPYRCSNLCPTAGTWRSNQVDGAHITFADIDAFVRGIKAFQFTLRRDQSAQSMLGNLQAACNTHAVDCSQCTIRLPEWYGHHPGMLCVTNVAMDYMAMVSAKWWAFRGLVTWNHSGPAIPCTCASLGSNRLVSTQGLRLFVHRWVMHLCFSLDFCRSSGSILCSLGSSQGCQLQKR